MSQTHTLKQGGIAIIDYGSQYTQLIARRIREQGVYAQVYAWRGSADHINEFNPAGYILSGGPRSIYDHNAPHMPDFMRDTEKPILGICYGMQALTDAFGGEVAASQEREYGQAILQHHQESALLAGLPETVRVWMSHGDRIETPPPGFEAVASSDNSPCAVIARTEKHLYGVQFHPEVTHTPQGTVILRNFLFNICECQPQWSSEAFIESAITQIQAQVGDEGRVILGLSGGVDSAVAGTLIDRAIGDRLTAIFVNPGLLRKNEAEEVLRVFRDGRGMNLIYHDATEAFMDALSGVTEPNAKRKIIGKLFIDVFVEEAEKIQHVDFLAQGTIYPDVIESGASGETTEAIKPHHNVGGLPENLQFDLIEPLRDLFKDEVRKVGTALGLPDSIVWRQPFPGPGLAIRCLGDITLERLEKLREADAIFLQELRAANLLVGDTAQCFAVLLPVKAVGVQGDNRTYEEVIALRAVSTDDFMTADWARLPFELLAKVSRRITNEVAGINRVVYDITGKPPGTIEWE
ncbi:MAG: glutamine-hydrolyzing GMP synthase [Aggregatilineales bacterium]